MRHTLALLVGSSVVYVVVAACSAASSEALRTRTDAAAGAAGFAGGGAGAAGFDAAGLDGAAGTLGTGGAAGLDGSTLDGFTDAIADALTDPVGDASAAPYESGTRIKARVLVGDDGARQFQGWHDTQLDVDCTFLTADDGKTRCLPYSTAAVGFVYADAACAQLFAYSSYAQPCPLPSYAISAAVPTSGSCGASAVQYGVVKIGAVVSTPVTVYQHGGGGSCVAASSVPTAPLHATTPVAASQFVAATEQLE